MLLGALADSGAAKVVHKSSLLVLRVVDMKGGKVCRLSPNAEVGSTSSLGILL